VRCAECPGPGACAAEAALGAMGSAALRLLEDMTLADLLQRIACNSKENPVPSLINLRRVAGAPVREAT
jgi:DNA-binding IscR family transcriptional regulator